jgi:hypothetical protein
MKLEQRIKKLEQQTKPDNFDVHVVVVNGLQTREQRIDDYLAGRQGHKPPFNDGLTKEQIKEAYLSNNDEKQIRFVERKLVEPKGK